MGLHLVTGPATAGKSGVLYAELERASREGSPVLALPAAPDVQRATAEFARKGLLGVQVIQLDQWIESLWLLHGDGRRIVSSAMRQFLLGRLTRAMRAQGRLEGAPDGAGFQELLGEIVQAVVADGARVPQSGAVAQVLSVCREYWKELEKLGHLESAEAARTLGANPPRDLDTVVLNRFTDLSAGQEVFIAGISTACDVTVALTWQEGLPSTQALDPLMARLLARGAKQTLLMQGEWSDPALDALADGLYRGATLPPPGNCLELLEAAGADAECAGVARHVSDLIDSGLEPGRIAVVARNMRSRAESLWAALQARGIHADVDVAVPLKATGFGAALFGLLTAALDPDAPREELHAFVLSPYSGVSAATAGEADLEWRKRRLRGVALLRAAREIPEMTETVNILSMIEDTVREPERCAVHWHRLAGLLLANAQRRRGLHGISGKLDAAAHRSLTRTVDEMAAGPLRLSLADVASALGRATVATGHSDERAVQVTEAHRVRGRRFEAVVLMGLTASEFSPEKPPSLAGVVLGQLGEHAHLDERLSERMLFYTVVTRARRRLLLSRQASDERGEAVRPSAFWDEVLDLYRDSCRPEGDPELSIARLTGSDVAMTAPTYTPGRLDERDRCGSGRLQMARGVLEAPDTLMHELDGHEYSASEIEAYLACPYRWFVQRALRPRELDMSFDSRERGTYAHGLLKAFYEEWHSRGLRRVQPDLLDDVLEIFSAVERSFATAASAKAFGVSETVAMAKATRWARSIVVDDADFLPFFEPVGHEVPFGSAHGVPFEFGGVRMAGRIDRVERGPEGVLAIDYKSAASVKGVRSFGTYGLVQPTVYAAAAAQLFDEDAAGGVYRSMRSLWVRGFWLEGALELGGRGTATDALASEQFEAEMARAADAVAKAVEGIRAGRIAPEPAKKTACDHCIVRGICGVS